MKNNSISERIRFKIDSIRKKAFSVALIAALLVSSVGAEVAFGAKSSDELDLQGSAAIVYSGASSEVIWGVNEEKKMNPASMTKMMTGLLAVENLDLDTVVTVDKSCSDPVYSGVNFVGGEKVTVEDLLYAAMLASSNSAASALAMEVAGSEKEFVKMMNERAEKIGCTGTSFANPHGLADENNYSTCKDMALICEEAYSNELLSKISCTKEYTIEPTNKYSEKREFNTLNYFLTGKSGTNSYGTLNVKKYKGIFGGKTGTAEDGEASMAVALEHEGKKLYCIVMGSKFIEKYDDLKKLMDYGKENVSLNLVFKKGAVFEDAKVWGGETNKVAGVASKAGYVNLPEGASVSLISTQVVYKEKLEAPVKKGDVIGKVQIYLAEDMISEVNLKAAEDVAEGWPLSAIRITNTQTIVLAAAAGLFVLLFILVLILRFINKRKRKKRRQQRIMEMAMRELEREQEYKQRNWPY